MRMIRSTKQNFSETHVTIYIMFKPNDPNNVWFFTGHLCLRVQETQTSPVWRDSIGK